MTTQRTDRLTIAAWSLWDWGSAAFNAVLVTFIFSVYLTDSVGKTISSSFTPTQWLSWTMTFAGFIIFLVTPVMGQRADRLGRRRRALGVWSGITFIAMALLFFIRNDDAQYFWLGLAGLAVGSVAIQFAEVNYFAQLKQVSTPENIGKISGIGWSAGYFGGIVLLLICYFGFIAGDGGAFGLSTEGGWNIRLVALLAALWFGLSAIPVLLRVPEIPPSGAAPENVVQSYRTLLRTLKDLWRNNRNGFYFLLSSALFRDGLSAIFAFGAILGVAVYGLDQGDVLLFGIAANVTSALGALIGGYLDDRVGPKIIIMSSLLILVAFAVIMFFVSGPTAFWVCGLILCLCVGPAQSSARGFLARIAEPGKEGEMFGLYATTGRAVSWLAPLLFGIFVSLTGSDRGGILAIGLVLALGALSLAPVKDPLRMARR